jgi:hypothetical protein
MYNKRPKQEEQGFRQQQADALLPSQVKTGNIKQTEERIRKDKTKNIIYEHNVKHVAVLKAADLRITELVLRIMVWLCLRNDVLHDSQMVIITWPRLELAVSLIQRMRSYFKPFGITFPDKETVLNLPHNLRIEVFASHHAATARGLPNVSFIFVDECSFISIKSRNVKFMIFY